MSKFLYTINDKLVIDYNNIKKYSNIIRIVIDDSIFFEGNIKDKLFLDIVNYNNGTNVKLYIKKSDDWFYIDSIFLSNLIKFKVQEENILKFLDVFETKVRCVLDEK